MNTAMKKAHGQDVAMSFAMVTGCLDGRMLVRLGSRVVPAGRAVGCLVAPQEGDRVVLAENGSGEAYVLSVLERASDEPAIVGIDAGFSLAAPDGTLGIVAGEVRLAAGQSIELAAPQVKLSANEAGIQATRLNLAGEHLSQTFAQVRIVAGAVERTVGRLVERIRRVYRRVEECEDTRLGRLRLRVDDSMRVNADRVTLQAEGNVRLDGKKILLG